MQTMLYAGVLLVIGALGWWAKDIHHGSGWAGMLAITLAFQAGFAAAGVIIRRRGFASIGGVLLAVTVFATPHWMVMELISIIVGVAVFAWWRRPFLLLPTLLFAYFLAMDGTAHVVHTTDYRTLGYAVGVYGAISFVAGVVLDYCGLRRYAFWPHIFAMLAASWAIGAIVAWDNHVAIVIAGVVATR